MCLGGYGCWEGLGGGRGGGYNKGWLRKGELENVNGWMLDTTCKIFTDVWQMI